MLVEVANGPSEVSDQELNSLRKQIESQGLLFKIRVIGSKVMSLKNVPAAQLEQGTREPLFPELWETISTLTGEFKPSY